MPGQLAIGWHGSTSNQDAGGRLDGRRRNRRGRRLDVPAGTRAKANSYRNYPINKPLVLSVIGGAGYLAELVVGAPTVINQHTDLLAAHHALFHGLKD